jgi:hypothetical protein
MSDRERAQTGPGQTGGGKGGFKRFRGPTDDQRKWSRKFQESQTPRTTPTPSAADQGMGGAMGGSVLSASPTSGPAPAPSFSRSALVQGAKKSGDFARVRDQYNTAAVGTGNRMDEMGNIKQRTFNPNEVKYKVFAVGNAKLDDKTVPVYIDPEVTRNKHKGVTADLISDKIDDYKNRARTMKSKVNKKEKAATPAAATTPAFDLNDPL